MISWESQKAKLEHLQSGQVQQLLHTLESALSTPSWWLGTGQETHFCITSARKLNNSATMPPSGCCAFYDFIDIPRNKNQGSPTLTKGNKTILLMPRQGWMLLVTCPLKLCFSPIVFLTNCAKASWMKKSWWWSIFLPKDLGKEQETWLELYFQMPNLTECKLRSPFTSFAGYKLKRGANEQKSLVSEPSVTWRMKWGRAGCQHLLTAAENVFAREAEKVSGTSGYLPLRMDMRPITA